MNPPQLKYGSVCVTGEGGRIAPIHLSGAIASSPVGAEEAGKRMSV
jgi:hypothetical protein